MLENGDRTQQIEGVENKNPFRKRSGSNRDAKLAANEKRKKQNATRDLSICKIRTHNSRCILKIIWNVVCECVDVVNTIQSDDNRDTTEGRIGTRKYKVWNVHCAEFRVGKNRFVPLVGNCSHFIIGVMIFAITEFLLSLSVSVAVVVAVERRRKKQHSKPKCDVAVFMLFWGSNNSRS